MLDVLFLAHVCELVLVANVLLDWPSRTDRLLGPAICLPRKDEGIMLSVLPNHVHNKRACRFIVHNAPFVLSAKQQRSEYHLFKSVDMTRVGI